jgi:hypothetical protein
MKELTDAIRNEVLEQITLVLAYLHCIPRRPPRPEMKMIPHMSTYMHAIMTAHIFLKFLSTVVADRYFLLLSTRMLPGRSPSSFLGF